MLTKNLADALKGELNTLVDKYTQTETQPRVTGDWKRIGAEGTVAEVPKGSTVRYGADGHYVIKRFPNGGRITLTNDTFGGDPAPNIVKSAELWVGEGDPPNGAGATDELITVRPTGVRANGVERRYPKQQSGENGQGYAQRLSRTINPETGAPYFPADWLGSFSPTSDPAEVAVDKRLYPDQWWDQATSDQVTRQQEEDRKRQAQYAVLQPGAIDIRTLNVDDLLFLKKHMARLQLKVGPTYHVNLFKAWYSHQGGQPPNEAAAAAADKLQGWATWDDSGYQGPLRALAGL
jgi:hypothetical protein